MPVLHGKTLRFRKVRQPATGCRVGGEESQGWEPGHQAPQCRLPISESQRADQTRTKVVPHASKSTQLKILPECTGIFTNPLGEGR